MITAKDINNKRFEQARPGYATNEVDDFLRDIAKDIAKYQKDKEELEKKIEVLVESVREYKKDEEALKDALVGAQKQGRQVIAEAQEKADAILSDANAKSDEILGSTKARLDKEKKNLANMQKEVTNFKGKLLSMYKHHLEQITAIPEYEDEDETPVSQSAPVEAPPSAKHSAYEDGAARRAEPSLLETPPSDPLADEPAMDIIDASPTSEIPDAAAKSPFDDLKPPHRAASRFGDLKFGNNS
jgi:cell division initiation protein